MASFDGTKRTFAFSKTFMIVSPLAAYSLWFAANDATEHKMESKRMICFIETVTNQRV